MKVWNYRISPTRGGEGWALIMIREDGFFAAVSDYGNYAYLWQHTGKADVREFFLRGELDYGYFTRKLGPKMTLDVEASFQNLRKHILEQRRDKSTNRDEARAQMTHLEQFESDNAWEAFLYDSETSELFQEPWEYAIQRYSHDVTNFTQIVMPKLAELIQAELAAERDGLSGSPISSNTTNSI